MSRLILILALAWMQTACVSGPAPIPGPSRQPPPPDLLTPFPPLPQPASAMGPDLLANHVMAAALYHECRARHGTLAEWAVMTPADRRNSDAFAIDLRAVVPASHVQLLGGGGLDVGTGQD